MASVSPLGLDGKRYTLDRLFALSTLDAWLTAVAEGSPPDAGPGVISGDGGWSGALGTGRNLSQVRPSATFSTSASFLSASMISDCLSPLDRPSR
jgi:hypothetical protein